MEVLPLRYIYEMSKESVTNAIDKSKKALVVVVAKEASHTTSINQFLEIYEIASKNFSAIDDFLDSGVVPEIIILSTDIVEKDALKAEMMPLCQVINYQFPNVQIFLATKSYVDVKLKETLSRFGVSKFITKDEIVSTSKLSSYISFYLKGKYFPIKSYEIDLKQTLPVDLYHLLPLNKKFLCLAKAGNSMRDETISSLADVGEFYIKREDIKSLVEYCRVTKPKGVSTLTRNARAFINGFSVLYKEFAYGLDSEVAATSFDQGKALFEELLKLANEMIEALNLIELNTLTEIVNLCTTHQLSIFDRAPAVSSYLAVITRQFNKEIDHKMVLLASLIYPLGLIMLPLDSNIELIKVAKAKTLESVKSILREVPELSLGICATRKIPIEPNLRTCILEIFEDIIGPDKRLAELSLETQLVRFAMELDRMVTKDLAKSSVDIKAAMRALCNPLGGHDLIFSSIITSKVMNIVNSQAT